MDQLHADTGRPDTRELSRVVAARLLDSAGVATTEPLTFTASGKVTRTPATWEELAPGDATQISQAALALSAWAASAPTHLFALAQQASEAHRRLAEQISRLQTRAKEVFSRAQELKIPADVICHSERFKQFNATNLESAQHAMELAMEAAKVRVDWVTAEGDFVTDLADVRAALGIEDW